MPFHPIDIAVHPVLQEFPAVFIADVPILVKQSFFYMYKRFWLTQGRNVQVSQGVAQVLLRYGCANRANGSADHSPWFACPCILSIRTGSMIECILEHARHGPVVFGCDE